MKTILLLFALLLINTINAQNFEWAKQFGSSGNDAANSVTTDVAGNVYVAGAFNGTVDFDPGVGVLNLTSAGSSDIFLIKLNASGNLLWVKQLGGPGTDYTRSVFVDASGKIYVTGGFSQTVDFDPGPNDFLLQATSVTFLHGTPPPPSVFTYEDIFILKLDVGGDFLWAKRIGGSGPDYGSTISVDAAGNIYTSGFFSDYRYTNKDTVDFDPGPGIFNLTHIGGFLLKLNNNGDFVWANSFGSLNTLVALAGGSVAFVAFKSSTLTISSIASDPSGNIYATGHFRISEDFDPGPGIQILRAHNVPDVFVAKFNATGSLGWVKQMSGDDPFTDGGTAVSNDLKIDGSGNVYITGAFAGTMDFDPGPGISNLKTTVTGGNSYDMKPFTDVDIFVSKLNSSGDLVWVKQMGGIADDRSSAIALDANGNVFTTGYFSAKADFDPGINKFKLNADGNGSNDSTDVFISKLDANGNFIWAGQLGGSGNDKGNVITTDASGNIYTVGTFRENCDFDPSSSDFNLTSSGFDDIFIHKMNQSGLITQRNKASSEFINEIVNDYIRLYPNPTRGVATISTKQNLSNASFRLFTISGQLIMEKKNISGSNYSFDISNQASGVYYAEIINGGKTEKFKVVKQ
jgi:hypothetical protein